MPTMFRLTSTVEKSEIVHDVVKLTFPIGVMGKSLHLYSKLGGFLSSSDVSIDSNC